jgi:molybdenum cofactor cytidylyltransferase
LHGAAGAASVVAAYGAFELPIDDIGCVTDIDTVAALQAAERLLSAP